MVYLHSMLLHPSIMSIMARQLGQRIQLRPSAEPVEHAPMAAAVAVIPGLETLMAGAAAPLSHLLSAAAAGSPRSCSSSARIPWAAGFRRSTTQGSPLPPPPCPQAATPARTVQPASSPPRDTPILGLVELLSTAARLGYGAGHLVAGAWPLFHHVLQRGEKWAVGCSVVG